MSQLITPDSRRRLQLRYEEARRLAAAARPNLKRIHELLGECVRADPGNSLYLSAMLTNLRRRSASVRDWWNRWFGAAKDEPTQPAHSVLSSQDSILTKAPDLLWKTPNDPAVFRQLADAAGTCDFDEVELLYLHAAKDAAPDNLQTTRMVARALTRQGRFADALIAWKSLGATDDEALQAIEDLSACDVLQDEDELSSKQAAAGADLSILEQREELRIARSAQQLGIAQRRAEHDPHLRAQSLVQRFESEHARVEIEILNLRCERLPADWKVRLELGRQLKLAGNYSGAIQRLEEATRLQPAEPGILIELGESWQHLRQFEKALDYYRQAIVAQTRSKESSATGPTGVLALYRAGVLAAAMGDTTSAAAHFAAAIAADPAFKDARQRLDNLRSN